MSDSISRLCAAAAFFALTACGASREPSAQAAATSASHAAVPSGAGPAADRAASPAQAAVESGSTKTYRDEPHDAIEDEVAVPGGVKGTRRQHPLDRMSDGSLGKMLLSNPRELGSMSIGQPSGGALFNGELLQPDELCEVVDSANAWGTSETIDFLRKSLSLVHQAFPGTPKLFVGHISSKRGGPLSPHLSHQSGRDVDISYFYRNSGRWYARANADNLDLERTWAFIRALIAETDVEMILIDNSIQRLLRDHALRIGEAATWVDEVFLVQRGKLPPIVRHARGHSTHMHIRFFNPIAQETARRLYGLLIEHDIVAPPTSYLNHRAKSGETLGKLARRYGTTVEAIQRANGLRNTRIRARQVYKIPRPGGVAPLKTPLLFPARRVPPPGR